MNKLLFIVLGFISFTCAAMDETTIQDATDLVTTTTSSRVVLK
jgi:hypothetical protein